MLFEIQGGGFGNKGAQLMLLTVLNQFRATRAQFYMSPGPNLPARALAELGLLRHFPTPLARGGRLFSPRFVANLALSSAFPRSICQKAGIARYQDSDGLIDVSGIRFGDAVGRTAGDNFIRLASYYRRRGKPVVLLPQMLGPFRKPESADLFRRLMPEVALIFARDRKSFEHAQEVVGPDARLKLAPDITVFSDVGVPLREEVPYALIVPNARMLDRGEAAWASTYVDLLVAAAQAILEVGLRPIVLVHSVENLEDNPLGEEVVRRVGEDRCSLRVAGDPVETKAFISQAKLIVASRYHSVVSALSTNVPAIVMGWAHKYDTLLQDFGVPHLQHLPEDGSGHLWGLVTQIAAEEENRRLRAILVAARKNMKAQSEEMWRLVASALTLQNDALLPAS